MNDDDPPRPTATHPGSPTKGFVPGGDLPPGCIVGEYRIDAAVGRGGMGVVYSATQPVIEKRVAIKVLHAQFSSDPALVRRFVDEARAVNRVRHDNIIDIFSFGQLPDGRNYFVMEYLEGATLAEPIDHGTLDLAQVPALLAQVCDALDAAHSAGIVHRDLKPENIWILTPRHGRQTVKLLDFGIAKLASAGDQNVTQTGVVMGTPHYMSPEQCYGRNVDHRTDIYAMGVLLYRIYAGRFPFDGDTFTEIIAKHVTADALPPSQFAQIPAALDRLILSCLSKDPALRPPSVRQLGADLSRAFAQPGDTAFAATQAPQARVGSTQAPTTLPEAPAGARRSGYLWVAGVVVLLAVIGVGVWARSRSSSGAVPAPAAVAPASVPVRPVASGAEKSEPVAAPPADLAKPAATGSSPDAGDGETRKRRAAVAPPESPAAGKLKPNRSRAADKGLVTDNPFE